MAWKHDIKAGELDRRIIIKQYSASRSTYGGETLTWSTLATVWAKIEPVSSGTGEQYESTRQTALHGYDMTIRYRSDIDEKMVISYNSVDYDILSITEVGRQFYQVLRVKRKE